MPLSCPSPSHNIRTHICTERTNKLANPQTLLGQANNRKLKKDRKKEIRKMEDKYQELEQRLSDLKRNSRGSTVSGGTRFYGDSPGQYVCMCVCLSLVKTSNKGCFERG